jgi:hypothetical protein
MSEFPSPPEIETLCRVTVRPRFSEEPQRVFVGWPKTGTTYAGQLIARGLFHYSNVEPPSELLRKDVSVYSATKPE